MGIKIVRDVVPKEFYRGDEEKPFASTVGEMIDQLNRLPKDLPIAQGFGDGCVLVVYNISEEDVHLSFEDVED